MANDYRLTIIVMGIAGFLLVLQVIIADLTAIRHKHKAGYPIPADSTTFLFRSARTHANTNESIAAFALLAVAGMLSSAPPTWINGLSAAWLVSRLAHMAFYYSNVKLPRSIAFGVSLMALLGLFLTTASAWL